MFAPALRRWIPLALLVALALGLRTYELDRRPLHADEANQAIKTGELLEHGRYAFDPRDHHGPTLYYAALPLAWLRGETTLATLSETTIRLVPALAGTCGVLLLFFLARPLGFGPAYAQQRQGGKVQHQLQPVGRTHQQRAHGLSLR
jgi:predicted membrane-bound mannosyltransferase